MKLVTVNPDLYLYNYTNMAEKDNKSIHCKKSKVINRDHLKNNNIQNTRIKLAILTLETVPAKNVSSTY